MCKFRILVLVPSHSADIEAEITHRMLPHSWHREVPAQDVPCFCIGKQALSEVHARTVLQMGALSTYKQAFGEVVRSHSGPLEMGDVDTRLGWDVYIEDYGRTERELFHKHPAKNDPDPKCPLCQGKGFRKSVKNPNAKWDKYTLTDILPIPDMLARGEVFLTLLRPRGILTEHGWRELGEISPITKTSVLRRDWYPVALRTLQTHQQCVAGVIECEI